MRFLLPLLIAGIVTLQALPPLPDLAFDVFPPSTRDAVSRAYRDASARPKDAKAVGALARTLQAWEQWDAAHQAYARAQALAPGAFEWHYLDAVVLQRLARHDEAAARLVRAVAISPDYLPARMKLAEAWLEMGEAERSRPPFEALAKIPEAAPAALVGLGRIAAMAGRHDEAIRQFEKAIALFPELGSAHYALARAYRATGRVADAERALGQHARYGPRWPRIEDPVLATVTGLRDDARATLQRGVSKADAGDVEGAIAAHEAALVRDPSLAHVHANLLSLYGRVKNWAKAEDHYRAALDAGISTADLHYDYGVVQTLQEKLQAGEDAYRRALAVNPLHTGSRNNLGQLLERRREFAAAAAEYRQAVESQPTFRLARFNLGRMLLALGEVPQALVEFEKLQQPQDAETPRYVFALATAHVRAGHRDEGIRLSLEAKRLALQYEQQDLAAAIDRELARLK